MEFHISRQARDRYQFDQTLYQYHGNVIFANFHAARLFAQKINQKQDLVNFPERAVKAGQINAMGLIDEILHHVIALYRQQKNPAVMDQALQWLEEEIGAEKLERTLARFTSEFPPQEVYLQHQTPEAYLKGTTAGVSNRAVALEELLMLWIANKNPAFAPYLELFEDDRLEAETAYPEIIQAMHEFLDTQPPFGPERQNLLDMLRSPAIAVPYSLTGQLEYIRERWAELLGRYLYRLLSSLDLVKEEEKLRFLSPGVTPIPLYGAFAQAGEAERFSPDREWMPRLVLIAKNTYVWLYQLSQKYQRTFQRLDEIPDAELETLARRGITGLWLIGLWERSPASARIKQLTGNPEAISSAYALAAYRIAADLGGEEAYRRLSEKAGRFGIRLASDMVPNHMGIDSDWVMEHPDWFISLDYSPFPSYTFNGPNLSSNPRVGIYLEDHYYQRSDAAVVFKRVDFASGETRYIYHGNDGTSMPWNDTAQLNYLKPEVRQAVIQTILDVARRFPIIRFDAAMTLTKQHYQRLWFPQPGSGGDIPSRAEHGLSKEQFDALMPVEFWREVVDRVAAEAPDTLLLAEAFWLMEGYFVRTLGMHRVYNSAFMNLLRNEENARYRLVMKNTLEFDPEILKRFVNFMNNPDERTAVDQFGKGDKYFGICTLMVTLPGLPMFGHGQIEGFSEKYGMEFRRPYWDEQADPYLVERHEREIFPLLHRRTLFAGIEHFLLYDFFNDNGVVDENVFAFSNGQGTERSLVVYHNRYAATQGWIRTSVGFMAKDSTGGQRRLVQRTLVEGLNLHPAVDTFVVFRDHVSGLQYIASTQTISEKGLRLELGAYKYHVFLDFQEVKDDAYGSYRQLCEYLNGRGVPDVREALQELLLQPVQAPFRQIANPGYLGFLYSARLGPDRTDLPNHLFPEAREKMSALLDGIEQLTGEPIEPIRRSEILDELERGLSWLLSLPVLETRLTPPIGQRSGAALRYLQSGLAQSPARWYTLLGWLFTNSLGKTYRTGDFEGQSRSWFDEWQLGKLLATAYQQMDVEESAAWKMANTVRLLLTQTTWYQRSGALPLKVILESWLSNEEIQQYLGVNRYQGILWFNQEAFEEWVWWMALIACLDAVRDTLTTTQIIERLISVEEITRQLLAAAADSEYQVARLLALAAE